MPLVQRLLWNIVGVRVFESHDVLPNRIQVVKTNAVHLIAFIQIHILEADVVVARASQDFSLGGQDRRKKAG